MLESAKLKLERAQHHIRDLGREFEAFVGRRPHRFAIKNDRQTGQPVIQVQFVEPIPDVFSVVIGDAVHNLRCALDHIVWEVVGIDGGAQNKHLMFPVRDNRVDFNGAVNGIQTPSAWVKDLLLGYEAFPGGRGKAFHFVHNLDVADKHRVIQPVLRATSHPPFQTYNADGTPCVRMEGNWFEGGLTEFVNIANIPPGGRLELDNDSDCPPDIFIPQLNGMSATAALNGFAACVAGAIREAEDAIRRNAT